MTAESGNTATEVQGPPEIAIFQSRLFRKYVKVFALFVSIILIGNGMIEVVFVYREQSALLCRIQVEQADAAAAKIKQFIFDIERQLDRTIQIPWDSDIFEQRQIDVYRVRREIPAITQLRLVDPDGHERLRISNLMQDVINSMADLTQDVAFREAALRNTFWSPVEFRATSVPFIVVARKGPQKSSSVVIADVDLRFLWDLIRDIHVGESGRAIIVDKNGRLIAAPDISLVLRSTSFDWLGRIVAANDLSETTDAARCFLGKNIEGESILTTFNTISPIGWTIFVELPTREAYEPIYSAIVRTIIILSIGLLGSVLVSMFLARLMVRPIRALQTGAVKIGAGDLDYKVHVRTNDELETLANHFNNMSAGLRESKAREERFARLRRFLSPQLAQLIESTGADALLESKRQDVSVFFCDMRGYTSFTETATPQEVTELLREYHSLLGQLIHKYDATLERFTGDGLMAFFNAPLPCPDPSNRAVCMAIDMQIALRPLFSKWNGLGYMIGFGIGIAHGEATTGRIGFEGRFDYAAIGPVVNLASRLCNEARDGQILVDSRVRGLLPPYILYEDLGTLSLKGFRSPVAVYNMLGRREIHRI